VHPAGRRGTGRGGQGRPSRCGGLRPAVCAPQGRAPARGLWRPSS